MGNTIVRVERGRIQDLAGLVVAKVANALDTSTDYLLGLTDEDTPQGEQPCVNKGRV